MSLAMNTRKAAGLAVRLLRPGPSAPACCSGCCCRRLLSTSSTFAASSKSRWLDRQKRDNFARAAKVVGYMSRAAFKLVEIHGKHHIFKPGYTVVDLGYAPGSWSQVALELIKPSGSVLGIDLIPAQPPRGVSTIQGNFLSPTVQRLVKEHLISAAAEKEIKRKRKAREGNMDPDDFLLEQPSYLDMGRKYSVEEEEAASRPDSASGLVDVVLSDMSEPWPQTYGFWLSTLSTPYRMMNTSGISFRDHALSMDLCTAALEFANETLRPGGNFVCKFYQGGEDKALEDRLRKLFTSVYREKPEASRSESKESYFVALKRKKDVVLGA